MKIWKMAAAMFSGMLLVSSVALAQQTNNSGVIYTSITAAEVAKVMQQKGFRAEISTDKDGDPTIASADSGLKFDVYFYNCDKQAVKSCKVVQFVRGVDLDNGTSMKVINDWNSDRLYGTAWLDDENDPYLGITLTFAGGVTEEHLAETLLIFTTNMGRFNKSLYEK
jgi:hypothetical protein